MELRTEATPKPRRTVPLDLTEALFVEVSNAKRVLATNPHMLPDKARLRATRQLRRESIKV